MLTKDEVLALNEGPGYTIKLSDTDFEHYAAVRERVRLGPQRFPELEGVDVDIGLSGYTGVYGPVEALRGYLLVLVQEALRLSQDGGNRHQCCDGDFQPGRSTLFLGGERPNDYRLGCGKHDRNHTLHRSRGVHRPA